MASDTSSRVQQALATYQTSQRKAGGNKTLRRQARVAFNKEINAIIESDGEAAVVSAFESATGAAKALRNGETSLVA